MKSLLLLTLLFTPLPSKAITWEQFWTPFSYRPYYRERYVPLCDKKIIHEDYVPGDYYRPGYVRRWTEWTKVPCDSIDVY